MFASKNDRQDESLISQALDQAGHCPLTGRHFEPWMMLSKPPEFIPPFIPLTGVKCSCGKIPACLPRSQLEKPRSQEPSQSALSYEHIKNFTKDLEVRRDLRNRASPVDWAHIKRPLASNYKS